MNPAYIVSATRTAVGKASKGGLRFQRPDDMACQIIKALLKDIPQLDKTQIDDLIVGCAMPEAEQGLNMGRLISLMSLDTDKVPGMTINRYCASGLEAIAIATAKIGIGMADCVIAGGVESMSYIPMGGYKPVPNYNVVSKGYESYYWGMGLTAEAVAKQYNISREEQDTFSCNSHRKALKAIAENRFADQITPVTVNRNHIKDGKPFCESYLVDTDEGPRADTSLEALSKLKPVFAKNGSVTAGNSCQNGDGAAFILIMSETMVKETGVTPIARLIGYSVTGVDPKIMGIGPVYAIPKVLKKTNLKMDDINCIELNEAFASQSLAVINELRLDETKINVNGGAIALGHPLGCTGAKLSVQILSELQRQKAKYGMVTMCVGAGQGAAGIFERC